MDYLCESMGLVEPNRSISPDKTMNMVLQCREQSSQVEVLHNCRNRCHKRDSFAHDLETAGGVLTKLIECTSPSPPRMSRANMEAATFATVSFTKERH